MRVFGFDLMLTKVSSAGGKNVPLETSSNPYERAFGTVSHGDYGKLLSQCQGWVYVGVIKNAFTVARYIPKLYAKKATAATKIIAKHIPVSDTFKSFLASDRAAHLRKFTLGAENVVEITEHPLIDLINKVNPIMNRFDMSAKTEMHLDLTGNAYWYLVLNQLGLPEQIWPLSPDRITINVSEKGSKTGEFITGYTYHNGVDKLTLKAEEVIHFLFPSPYSNLYGYGPTAAGQDSIIFDHTSRSFENTLLNNQCRPDVTLQTEQTINDATYKTFMGRLRNSFAGKKGLGKWLLLDKGLKPMPLNFPPREMGFQAGRKMSKEEIAGVLGIPVSKLTTEDVNLANAYVGSIQYITDTIAPRLTMMEEKMNERLTPMYDENLFLTYGDVIPTDRNFRLLEIEKHLTTKYSSINEERKKDGLEPVEWGNKPVEAASPAMGGGEVGKPTPENPEGAPKKTITKDEIDLAEEQEEFAQEIMSRVLARLNS